MDSPEWLNKELNMLVSVAIYPNVNNEDRREAVKQAAASICQHFEAANGKFLTEWPRWNQHVEAARKIWYNQPDQEAES